MSELICVRGTPCGSCPYRQDVPSGLWHASEYDKLPQYDGEIADQAAVGAFYLFFCHRNTGKLCSGWAGYRDPRDLLAIRLNADRLDLSVFEHSTDVPLFGTGREAAEHGKREIEAPGPDAARKITQLTRIRERRDPA